MSTHNEELLDRYAAVGRVVQALRRSRKGDREGTNEAVAGMPVNMVLPACLALCEGAFLTLAAFTGKDFDTLVEAVVVETVGLGIASDIAEGPGHE